MKQSHKKNHFTQLKNLLPYLVVSFFIISIVFIGSLDKKQSSSSFSLASFTQTTYENISTDQLSELHLVASLSNAFNFTGADDIASNYIITTAMRSAGQTSAGKLEKPNIVYVSSRGVITYTVVAGDTIESIAQKHHLTPTQVRWSNQLKKTTLSAGQILYLPSGTGIVYTVKANDTIDTIANKYGSSATEIIALNDLEVSGVSAGMRIFIKDGSLPLTERPEYTPPTRIYSYTYSYTYSGVYFKRDNLRYISRHFYDTNYPYPANPGVAGWCTWYAWYWRATNPNSLGKLGREGRNANTWHRNYAYRTTGNQPRVGAVFQTRFGGGGYGHVGVVLSINANGSITVREMNYAGRYVVTEAEIPAENVRKFTYIY